MEFYVGYSAPDLKRRLGVEFPEGAFFSQSPVFLYDQIWPNLAHKIQQQIRQRIYTKIGTEIDVEFGTEFRAVFGAELATGGA